MGWTGIFRAVSTREGLFVSLCYFISASFLERQALRDQAEIESLPSKIRKTVMKRDKKDYRIVCGSIFLIERLSWESRGHSYLSPTPCSRRFKGSAQ